MSAVTAVHFGSEPATSFVVDSPTQITATSPPGTAYQRAAVTLTNGHGTSAPVSADEFAYADPPDAPYGASAMAGGREATVSFNAPSHDGGSPITTYTVTSSPGGVLATGASSPITVTGLNVGTTYSFTVIATNDRGDSTPTTSNTITTFKSTTTTAEAQTGTYYGTPIDLEATVGSAYAGAPAGTVQFTSGRSTVGSATVGTRGRTTGGPSVVLDVGSTVTAGYEGDAAFEPSSGELPLEIRPATTATRLTSSADPADPGAQATVTASVSNTSTPVIPFGAVQFAVDGNDVSGPQALDSSGQASISIRSSDGSHRVTASYHDDTNSVTDFVDSQAMLTQSFGTTTSLGPAQSTTTNSPTRPGPVVPGTRSPANTIRLTRPVALADRTIVIAAQASEPGVITYRAHASIAHRSVPYAVGLYKTDGRRPVVVVVRLTSRVREALARYHRVRVLITFDFAPRRGGRHATAQTWVTLAPLVKGMGHPPRR